MHFHRSFEVAASLDTVSDFHRHAESLEAITPPFVPMQLDDVPDVLQEGSEMRFTLWLGPLPVRWQARLEDVSKGGFVDVQVSGPFREWRHEHRFERLEDGRTRVVDDIRAHLKKHPLWAFVGLKMWVGLPALFAYRRWKTRQLLQGQM